MSERRAHDLGRFAADRRSRSPAVAARNGYLSYGEDWTCEQCGRHLGHQPDPGRAVRRDPLDPAALPPGADRDQRGRARLRLAAVVAGKALGGLLIVGVVRDDLVDVLPSDAQPQVPRRARTAADLDAEARLNRPRPRVAAIVGCCNDRGCSRQRSGVVVLRRSGGIPPTPPGAATGARVGVVVLTPIWRRIAHAAWAATGVRVGVVVLTPIWRRIAHAPGRAPTTTTFGVVVLTPIWRHIAHARGAPRRPSTFRSRSMWRPSRRRILAPASVRTASARAGAAPGRASAQARRWRQRQRRRRVPAATADRPTAAAWSAVGVRQTCAQ